MSNVVAIEPILAAPLPAPPYRKMRPLSRALSVLFTVFLVLAALFPLATIVVLAFFSGYVQMNADGANISIGPHGAFPHAIPGMVRLSDQPVITHLAGAVAIILSNLPIAMVFWHLRGLFALYAQGIVFARENAIHLKRVGIWLIAYPFAKFVSNMIFRAAGGVDHAWFRMELIDAFVLGLIVFVIAQVMEFGGQIEEEKDSFI